MQIISLCEDDKRYLLFLLTMGSDVRNGPLTARHLIDGGYIIERYIGSNNFEYSASDACRLYFRDNKDQLKVEPLTPLSGGCNFGYA